MIGPRDLNRKSELEVTRGAKVFYRALKSQYDELILRYINDDTLTPNPEAISKALRAYHLQVGMDSAKWQYEYLERTDGAVKAMQIGMYERILKYLQTFIQLNTGAKIKSISETTLKHVQDMIEKGKEQGWGARKIAANMRKEAKGAFTAYRATVIARTESTAASSEGHRLSAEQWEKVTGKKKFKAWSAANSPRTRDAHIAMIDSAPIPGDQDFIVGGSSMSAPGDPKGGAANVINCRCRVYYMSERVANRIIRDLPPRVVKPKPVEPKPEPKPAEPVDPYAQFADEGPAKPRIQFVEPEDLEDDTDYPQRMPAALLDYEKKHGIKVNKEIFELLEDNVPLTHERGGTYFRASTSSVNFDSKELDDPRNPLFKSDYGKKVIVYHEYGHAVDHQLGLSGSPEIKAMMNKYRDLLSTGKYKYEYASLHSQVMTDARVLRGEELDQAMALADTLQALNPMFGAGHSREYYKMDGNKEAEFIAHAFENKYAGNAYFQKHMPELYEDQIAYIDLIRARQL